MGFMAKGNAARRFGLLPIQGCNNPNRSGDVIFVHGLGDHPIKAWHPNPREIETEIDTEDFWQSKLPTLDFWLNWLGEYRPDLGIWSYGYEAMPFEEGTVLPIKEKGKASPIFDQASDLLKRLEMKDFRERPRIFVTHSLGGLVVKETLYSAYDYINSNPKMREVLTQTKGVVFLGTPHQGANLADFQEKLAWIAKASGLLRPNYIIDELRSDSTNTQLSKIGQWYSNNAKALNIATEAFYETEDTNIPGIGKRRVVDRHSSSPNVEGVKPVALPGADHFSIAKPSSKEQSLVYQSVKEFIDEYLPRQQGRQVENRINPNPMPASLNPDGTTSEGLGTVPVWESMVKILDSDGNTVGSGFMIHSDGYFITCHQVIYHLNSINVEYLEKNYQSTWCEEFSNPEVDVAILKIDVEDAKPIPIAIPKDQMISAIVYGFPHKKTTTFSKGFDVYETLDKSYQVNTISTYDKTIDVKFANSWNKKPQDKSTFFAYKINGGENGGIDRGVCGGAVLDEESVCVIGVIQSSQNNESYVISWENITDRLNLLEIDPNQHESFSTLTPRSSSTSTTETSSDIYLPKPGYRTLLGRDTEIKTIKEVLRDTKRGRIIGVDGFGGIGKTALVQEIIKAHSDIGFNKVLWQTASTTDNSEQMTFETVLDGIARQLNRSDIFKLNREEREIKTRELLHEQPVLIVLDNMETSSDPQDEIIQKLLPILGSSKALLTSRHRFTEAFGNNLFPIHLRGLNKEAARDLMKDTANQKNMVEDFNRAENKLDQMIQVTGDESFGYTPMALKFILGQLQKFDPDIIIDGLEGVRLTDEDGEISDQDEFKQFWKRIFFTSWKLLDSFDSKFMFGMTLFEPNVGSNAKRIMSTISLNNEEFRQVINKTWKVSFLEIGRGDSSKTYYQHRLSYTFFFAILLNIRANQGRA